MALDEVLSPDDIDVIRRALGAAVEGGFFPEWEFRPLFGVERTEVRQVLDAWPRRTVDDATFESAVMNTLNNLVAYPHGMDAELTARIPEGEAALVALLRRLDAFFRPDAAAAPDDYSYLRFLR